VIELSTKNTHESTQNTTFVVFSRGLADGDALKKRCLRPFSLEIADQRQGVGNMW